MALGPAPPAPAGCAPFVRLSERWLRYFYSARHLLHPSTPFEAWRSQNKSRKSNRQAASIARTVKMPRERMLRRLLKRPREDWVHTLCVITLHIAFGNQSADIATARFPVRRQGQLDVEHRRIHRCHWRWHLVTVDGSRLWEVCYNLHSIRDRPASPRSISIRDQQIHVGRSLTARLQHC
jgi:hypothetical protein